MRFSQGLPKDVEIQQIHGHCILLWKVGRYITSFRPAMTSGMKPLIKSLSGPEKLKTPKRIIRAVWIDHRNAILFFFHTSRASYRNRCYQISSRVSTFMPQISAIRTISVVHARPWLQIDI